MKNDYLDNAIKFGAGRYQQGIGLLEKCGAELKRFGKKVYIVSGVRAFEAVKERLLPSLEREEINYVVEIFEEACSYKAAEECAQKCLEAGCDEVVGIGGGKIMDFSKAVAKSAGVGVVNIPTSISTCAAFTNMSVMYTTDGIYDGSWRYEYEVDAVIVDLDIIVNCPSRFAAAGILDAMAKKIEIQNGKAVMLPDENTFDKYTSYRIAEYAYDILEYYGKQAIKDIEKNKITTAVEYVTFINIAVTGLIANITKSFNQAALAHEMYYGIRTYFTKVAEKVLHGEIVAVGLFVQLYYNRLSSHKEKLLNYMKEMNMPLTLSELGIDITDDNLNILETYLLQSPYVECSKESQNLIHEAITHIKY